MEIAYYEFPTALTQTENGWQVDCMGFGTKRRVICKQIVDCTGGAEVVGLLGLERLRGEERQPGHTSSRLEILTILHQANSNAFTCTGPTLLIPEPLRWPT